MAIDQVVDRDDPDLEKGREELVKRWQDTVKTAWKFWEDQRFRQMREDMRFARGKQWPNDVAGYEKKYVANLVQRHIRQGVASLYAKNPTAKYERRRRLDFRIWDGDHTSMINAFQQMQEAAMTGMMAPPEVTDLLMDIQQGTEYRKMIDKVGATLEVVYAYYMDEQTPPFKTSFKKLINRVKTCGVGYVDLGFQRIMKQDPDAARQIADITVQLDHMQRLSDDIADGEVEMDSAEAEELKLMLGTLQQAQEILVREGLVFDFPKSTAIIPDPDLKCLQGWVGATWVAREFYFTPEKIQEIYGINVGQSYTGYAASKDGFILAESTEKRGNASNKKGDKARVWVIYDRDSGHMYSICEGYKDWLEEPAPPPVAVEQFIPIYPLTFNDVEDDDEGMVIPPSDVMLIRDPQLEYNRAKEGLRQHRRANAPKYISRRDSLQPQDKDKIQMAVPHEVIEVDGLMPGQKVDDLIQTVKFSGVDPNLYDTSPALDDIMRVGGSQEANLGSLSGGSATEASIAQSTRTTDLGSNADDVDDFLTILARDGAKILLREISEETAVKIAGPGAHWPQLSLEQLADEIGLKTVAGSSGKPNAAQEVANFERMAPFLMQAPGVSPEWFITEAIRRMDDKLDMADVYVEGLPSMLSMGKQAQMEGQDQQAAGGANNDEKAPGQDEQGPQAQTPPPEDGAIPGVAGQHVPPGAAAM